MRELSIKNSKRIQKAMVDNKISVAKLLLIIDSYNQEKIKLERGESFLFIDYDQPAKKIIEAGGFKLEEGFNSDDFPSAIETLGRKEKIIVKKFNYKEIMSYEKIKEDLESKGFRMATFLEKSFFLLSHRKTKKLITFGTTHYRQPDNLFVTLFEDGEIKAVWLDDPVPIDCEVLAVKII